MPFLLPNQQRQRTEGSLKRPALEKKSNTYFQPSKKLCSQRSMQRTRILTYVFIHVERLDIFEWQFASLAVLNQLLVRADRRAACTTYKQSGYNVLRMATSRRQAKHMYTCTHTHAHAHTDGRTTWKHTAHSRSRDLPQIRSGLCDNEEQPLEQLEDVEHWKIQHAIFNVVFCSVSVAILLAYFWEKLFIVPCRSCVTLEVSSCHVFNWCWDQEAVVHGQFRVACMSRTMTKAQL